MILEEAKLHPDTSQGLRQQLLFDADEKRLQRPWNEFIVINLNQATITL
jgi:hypothetical protein